MLISFNCCVPTGSKTTTAVVGHKGLLCYWVVKSQGVETSRYWETVNKAPKDSTIWHWSVVAIKEERQQRSVLNSNWSLLIEVKQHGTLYVWQRFVDLKGSITKD